MKVMSMDLSLQTMNLWNQAVPLIPINSERVADNIMRTAW